MKHDTQELPLLNALPSPSKGEGIVATTGTPLKPGTRMAPREEIVAALRSIYDPEIPVNIYDLGLIYEFDIGEDGSVHIEMTLTAPACPVAGQMPNDVAQTAAALEGVGEVEVKLIWELACTGYE